MIFAMRGLICLRKPDYDAIESFRDNLSKTFKEGVSRAYKGVDGFSPIFGYLGKEGYLVNLELREGGQHCQKETPQFITACIEYAQKITDQSVLVRLDSAMTAPTTSPVVGQKMPN